MNGVTVLLVLLVFVAGFSLLQRRRLLAILGMSVFSLLLAAVFLFASAPDVAITEAAIGAALGTFVYVLAIRKSGRLVVAANDVPGLLHEEAGALSGLEFDLLQRVAAEAGLELVVQLMPLADIEPAVRRGDADIGAGGLLRERAGSPGLIAAPPHLPTARFVVRRSGDAVDVPVMQSEIGELTDLVARARGEAPFAVELDLARALALSRAQPRGLDASRLPGETAYAFVLSQDRPELLRRVTAEIDRLRRTGELDDLARRHLA